MMQKIRFQDKEYLFLDGVIATEEQYRKGETAYAFLKEKDVLRYHKVIGFKDDIEFIGEIEDIEPDPEAFFNILDRQTRLFENPSLAALLRQTESSKEKGGTVKFRRYDEG